MSDPDEPGNFTRIKFKAQTGDGPDQRGEVTVEVRGTLEEGSPDSVREEAEEQLDEAAAHLRGVLGL